MIELEVGNKVTHPKMSDWGVGKVVEIQAANKVRVFFLNAGEKLINTQYVGLEKLDEADGEHPILDNPTFIERAKNGKKHIGLPEARSYFLKLYSHLGFEDHGYLEEERNYKVDASDLLHELLGEQEFTRLLSEDDFDEIVKRALQVVNKTNLIFPNEKMALKDGLKSSEHIHLFAERLFNLLYKGGEFKKHFEAFADCLVEIGADKWTTATYFPFLAYPDEHMFLKPEITKHAAELVKAELNYKSDLNWLTYSCLLDFARYLKQELISMGLPPRDMIDVQSFMWCIAPGKSEPDKEGSADFTAEQYLKALRGVESEGHFDNSKYRDMLVAQYQAEDHVITATQLSEAAGYANYNAANLQYGTLAKHVAGHLGYLPPKRTNGERMWWFTLSDGNKNIEEADDNHFQFIMRHGLVKALEKLNWVMR